MVRVALSAVPENSPALQRWVLIQQNQSSPVRDERMVLPSLAGLFISCASSPSHEWLGYFRMRSTSEPHDSAGGPVAVHNHHPLRLGSFLGEGVDHFDLRLLGGVHDLDDFAEGRVFVGAQGEFQLGIFFHAGEQLAF